MNRKDYSMGLCPSPNHTLPKPVLWSCVVQKNGGGGGGGGRISSTIIVDLPINIIHYTKLKFEYLLWVDMHNYK